MRENEYSHLADDVLFDLIHEDDEHAFSMLYQRFSSILYVHAYSMLRDRDEVKDIIQQVFIKIWERRHELKHQENVSSYLHQSIKNAVINVLAHHKVVDKYLDNLSFVANRSTNDTDFMVREKELNEILEQEIAQLPPKMRQIFELSRKDNLSHGEIASLLGISEKTVRNQISNALSLLKSRLPIILAAFIFPY
ncbi:RNA polymerase sigma factor [Sphingobacterium corticis]|uniref:RNA polymerase sigma factor n=1 Tax=Sphingobacterium corticis TaxID=1812823 RepID=A0ABW5NJY9_9SPHI